MNKKSVTTKNKSITTKSKTTTANVTRNRSTTMDNKIWLNKEDVERDFPLIAQQEMDIDGPFSVMGNRPPPMHLTEDYDDQIKYLYGDYHSEIMSEGDNETMEPDLAGITYMLRMVDEYNNDEYYNDDEKDTQLAGNADIGVEVSISKLNPSAPDYIPKSMDTSGTSKTNESELVHSENSNMNNSSTKDSRTDEIVCKDNLKTCGTETNSHICLDKRLDVTSLNPDEIKNMREELKLKIKETSNAKTHKKKRDRNLAIATLTKLYTAVPNSTENKTIELIKPEYFETPPRNNFKTEDSGNRIIHDMVHGGEINTQLLNVEEANVEDSRNGIPISEPTSLPLICSTVTSKKDTRNCNTHKEFTQQNDLTEEINESITKVNGWLSNSSSSNSLPEKKKHKAPVIYSGPVTFKRKEGTKSVTHVKKPVETPKYEKPSEYVPSVYANELTEKYTERQKANSVRTEDIWGKLERELKERDAAIKAKQNEEPRMDQQG